MVILCFNSGLLKKVCLTGSFFRVSPWYLASVAQEKELLTVETTPLWVLATAGE